MKGGGAEPGGHSGHLFFQNGSQVVHTQIPVTRQVWGPASRSVSNVSAAVQCSRSLYSPQRLWPTREAESGPVSEVLLFTAFDTWGNGGLERSRGSDARVSTLCHPVGT